MNLCTSFQICVLLLSVVSCQHDAKPEQADFSPLTKAVLRIEKESNQPDTLSISASTFTIIPRNWQQSEQLHMVKREISFLHLQVDRSHTAKLRINDSIYYVVLSPGDTTTMIISGNDSITYKGKFEMENRYYMDKKNRLGFDNVSDVLSDIPYGFTHQQFLLKVDSIIKEDEAFTEKYSAEHNLPSWFADYELSEIKYKGLRHKLVEVKNPENFTDTCPDDYYEFLKNLELNDERALRSFYYYSFLDDFFVRTMPATYQQLAGITRADSVYRYIAKESSSVLSERVSEVYRQYMFTTISQLTSDTLLIRKLAQDFRITRYKRLLITKNLNVGKALPDFDAKMVNNEMFSLRSLSGKVVYINFWSTWCGPCVENIPNLNAMIADFESNSDIVFVNVCMNSDEAEWRKRIAQTNLKGINVFADDRQSQHIDSLYQFIGVPVYTLADKENVLIENNTGKAPAVATKIKRILSVLNRQRL